MIYNNIKNEFIPINSQNFLSIKYFLEKHYNEYIKEIKPLNSDIKCGFLLFLKNIKYYDIKIFLEFNSNIHNILNFFGYYISSFNNYDYSILISPIYSTNVTYKLNENNNICYHFTTEEKIESIFKNGLRCKQSDYRYFPKRIYLYITDNIFDQNNKIKQNIYKFLKEIEKTENIYAIKVNLNISIYQDDTMNDINSVYTYCNIPPKYLTLINKKISL